MGLGRGGIKVCNHGVLMVKFSSVVPQPSPSPSPSPSYCIHVPTHGIVSPCWYSKREDRKRRGEEGEERRGEGEEREERGGGGGGRKSFFSAFLKHFQEAIPCVGPFVQTLLRNSSTCSCVGSTAGVMATVPSDVWMCVCVLLGVWEERTEAM